MSIPKSFPVIYFGQGAVWCWDLMGFEAHQKEYVLQSWRLGGNRTVGFIYFPSLVAVDAGT